jgi:hypothetical protein
MENSQQNSQSSSQYLTIMGKDHSSTNTNGSNNSKENLTNLSTNKLAIFTKNINTKPNDNNTIINSNDINININDALTDFFTNLIESLGLNVTNFTVPQLTLEDNIFENIEIWFKNLSLILTNIAINTNTNINNTAIALENSQGNTNKLGLIAPVINNLYKIINFLLNILNKQYIDNLPRKYTTFEQISYTNNIDFFL